MTANESSLEGRHVEVHHHHDRGIPGAPMQRTASMDGGEYVKGHPSPHQPKGRPPHPPYSKQHSYSSMPYSNYNGSRPPQQLQSVVTSSFCSDDEREMQSSRNTIRHVNAPEHRWAPEERHPESHENESREPDQEGRHPPPRDVAVPRPVIVPGSPRVSVQGRYPMVRRSGSSSYMIPPEPMKRSFWHHARSNEEYSSTLPPEFIPPKRAKVTPPPRDITVSVRSSPPEVRDLRRPPSSFFGRSMSWDSRDAGDPYYHRVHESSSFSSVYREEEYGTHMSEAPPRMRSSVHSYTPESYPHVSPSNASSARRWSHSSPSHSAPPSWSPPMSSPRSAVRPSPTYHPHLSSPQGRDDVESTPVWISTREREPYREMDSRRIVTYEHRHGHEAELYHAHHPPPHSPHSPHSHHYSTGPPMSTMPPTCKAISPTGPNHMTKRQGPPELQPQGPDKGQQTTSGQVQTQGKDGPLLLLALPQDRISLSETLCVVRENIEVFTATKSDVEAPAPGRKHAVVVDQVGLRCIHCRHTTRSSDRVKRAVCYPSSIKRIYRTVIDMKLDHFLQCKYVPTALKERLTELKVKHTRSTGTTMQYFIRAAHQLGMEDGTSGVRLTAEAKQKLDKRTKPTLADDGKVDSFSPKPPKAISAPPADPRFSELPQGANEYRSIRQMDSMSSDSNVTTVTPDGPTENENTFTGKVILALREDKMALSPLRCFLREQVCAFSATEEDIAVRAPTTFAISVGQVGIGCIHCVNQPAKLRSNRAVCFPFSIARIYQSVADIQRFHFGECKCLPPDVKEKFLSLQRASSKGSKGLATRQYWVTSARKIGLVDTARGIRFGRDPSRPEATSMSLDILAQVAFNVTTASRALVLPEDKPYIAEFLYVVMEQLQPCRFTEADRNKRRLKDVGCIGVECKHCAGQVDGRKFFWSSVNAVESNFVSVHTHMMECRCVPVELKEKLAELKKLRKEQTAALKTGSQKAFFSRVWARLHGEGKDGSANAPGPVGAGSSDSSPRRPAGAGSPNSSTGHPAISGSPNSPSGRPADGGSLNSSSGRPVGVGSPHSSPGHPASAGSPNLAIKQCPNANRPSPSPEKKFSSISEGAGQAQPMNAEHPKEIHLPIANRTSPDHLMSENQSVKEESSTRDQGIPTEQAVPAISSPAKCQTIEMSVVEKPKPIEKQVPTDEMLQEAKPSTDRQTVAQRTTPDDYKKEQSNVEDHLQSADYNKKQSDSDRCALVDQPVVENHLSDYPMATGSPIPREESPLVHEQHSIASPTGSPTIDGVSSHVEKMSIVGV